MDLYPHLIWKIDEKDYNCSSKTLEEWAATGLRRPLIGTYYVIYGSIISALYITVIFAMTHKSILHRCCYKLMYFNCFFDFVNVFLNSIVSGYLMIDGAVFCTHPLIILLAGEFGLAFWCGTCANCIIIGINRFCTIFGVGMGYFQAHYPYFWMSIPLLYTLFVLFFTRPVIFNSNFGAWLLTPLTDDFLKEVIIFKNKTMMLNNFVTPVALSAIYVLIISKVYCKHAISSQQVSKAQFKICAQSAVICGMTALVAYCYAYMQLFPVPAQVVTGIQVLYQYCLQCLVYLVMNQAIRKRAARLIFQLPLPSSYLMNSSTREQI